MRSSLRYRQHIAVCVTDPSAREHVRLALERDALEFLLLTPADLASNLSSISGCRALIYDLEPMTSGGIELVAAVRAYQPWMPILLYPALREGVLELMLETGRIPGILAKEQVRDRAEAERIRRFVQRGLHAAPAAHVAGIVSMLLSEAPPRLLEFADAAVQRLAQPECDRTVAEMARGLGFTARTLQRAWPGQQFPQPKELLDWLTLLVVSYVASWSGVSLRTVSRILGVEPNTFYRLRRRLMPAAPRPRGEQPAHEFDLVLLAFAERCRVPRKRAADIQAQIG